jgi:hypothetical protein
MATWNPTKSRGVKIMRWDAYTHMDIKFNNIIRFVETLLIIIMVAVFLWVNLFN